MNQQQFYTELKETIRKKLGRSEGAKVTNNAVNEISSTLAPICKGMQATEVLDHLKTIKPAKSITELQNNIIEDLKAGTRSDQTELDTQIFSFTFTE